MSLVQLNNITKSYTVAGETYAILKWINLTIDEGDFLAIMWPSGSGKSTLMNIIGMLDVPDGGDYILNGRNVGTMTWDEQTLMRGKSIGFIFQSYNLIKKMSVFWQVELPLLYQWIGTQERIERVTKALDIVWLSMKHHSLPNELSWWQQQRVSIARAIACNPTILLADEPTWALDSTTSKEVMDIFHTLNNQWKTIIMITHDNEIAAHATRTVHIRDGLLL